MLPRCGAGAGKDSETSRRQRSENRNRGTRNGTSQPYPALSRHLSQGGDYHALIEDWEGSVQWIAQSPYRIYHKRKNWFVGVQTFTLSESQEATEAEIRYETLRASGPGGQHVNKTESAVRAVHIPTGMNVVASDQRSQWQNKKLATERLLLKLASWSIEQAMIQAQANWSNHNCLQRGNPVKVIQEPLI